MVFCPAFRGENDNPGRFELLYGELDDLLAARDFLAAQPFVAPERIYLIGDGISGGTLVLLAAVASDRFRAAMALGGAAELGRIVSQESSSELVPFDASALQRELSALAAPLCRVHQTADVLLWSGRFLFPLGRAADEDSGRRAERAI